MIQRRDTYKAYDPYWGEASIRCGHCKCQKGVSQFCKNKRACFGLDSPCKRCKSAIYQEHDGRARRRERRNARARACYRIRRDRELAKRREVRASNPEKFRGYRRKYYQRRGRLASRLNSAGRIHPVLRMRYQKLANPAALRGENLRKYRELWILWAASGFEPSFFPVLTERGWVPLSDEKTRRGFACRGTRGVRLTEKKAAYLQKLDRFKKHKALPSLRNLFTRVINGKCDKNGGRATDIVRRAYEIIQQ